MHPPDSAATSDLVTETLAVVIPTYGRDGVLVDTLSHVLALSPPPDEILVVDQSRSHEPAIERRLADWHAQRRIDRLRLPRPSIPAAMNAGLERATAALVLFLDDDVVPDAQLVDAHRAAHRSREWTIVAGRVVQPWHADGSAPMTGFAGHEAFEAEEFMGGNFSIRRDAALALGGFDERFVGVAYRFEAELAARVRASGGRIRFEPRASLRHLKAPSGGTRVFGDHLRTIVPMHTVGAYYYLMRARPRGWLSKLVTRPIRSVSTRHHLRRPWWILPSLLAEFGGLAYALTLLARGPKLLRRH